MAMVMQKASEICGLIDAGVGIDVACNMEFNATWPPTNDLTQISLCNLSVASASFWKGFPPNVDVAPIAKDMFNSGFDTVPSLFSHMQHMRRIM